LVGSEAMMAAELFHHWKTKGAKFGRIDNE
jgi:hypothetical protein